MLYDKCSQVQSHGSFGPLASTDFLKAKAEILSVITTQLLESLLLTLLKMSDIALRTPHCNVLIKKAL